MLSRVLLFSGGADSFITWRLLGMPQCLYVAIDHAYQSQELATIRALDDACTQKDYCLSYAVQDRLTLNDLEQEDGHIPLRNLYLALIASEYGQEILFGAMAGERSTDKSARFYRDTSRMLTHLRGQPYTVVAPFRHLTKTQLVSHFLSTYPDDVDLLLLTRSCYAPSALPCGRCMACFRRWVSFSLNGIHETFALPPWEWDGIRTLPHLLPWITSFFTASPTEWKGILAHNADATHALLLKHLRR